LQEIRIKPLSSIYENTVSERTNQSPVKAMSHDERFSSLAQIDKLYQDFKSEFCMLIVLLTGRHKHAKPF